MKTHTKAGQWQHCNFYLSTIRNVCKRQHSDDT